MMIITNMFFLPIASITYFLVYKASVASANTDEFINDPRNPRFASGGKIVDLEKEIRCATFQFHSLYKGFSILDLSFNSIIELFFYS